MKRSSHGADFSRGRDNVIWHQPVWSTGAGCCRSVGYQSHTAAVIDFFAAYNILL